MCRNMCYGHTEYNVLCNTSLVQGPNSDEDDYNQFVNISSNFICNIFLSYKTPIPFFKKKYAGIQHWLPLIYRLNNENASVNRQKKR